MHLSVLHHIKKINAIYTFHFVQLIFFRLISELNAVQKQHYLKYRKFSKLSEFL